MKTWLLCVHSVCVGGLTRPASDFRGWGWRRTSAKYTDVNYRVGLSLVHWLITLPWRHCQGAQPARTRQRIRLRLPAPLDFTPPVLMLLLPTRRPPLPDHNLLMHNRHTVRSDIVRFKGHRTTPPDHIDGRRLLTAAALR